MSTLLPGFDDPVAGAQSSFRAVLEAMARPGRLFTLPHAPDAPAPLCRAAGAVLLTLADAETPVFTDAGAEAEAWARFHCGSPLVAQPAEAAFLLCRGAPPPLAALAQGSDEEPHLSATLILQVRALVPGEGWRLTGPGIEHEHRLRVDGAPGDFLAQWAANAEAYPCGVDVILCCGDAVAALPRGVTVKEG